jgi:hypothetical protein
MTASIMRDRAKAARREEEQLVVPGVGSERPAVTEDERLHCAPIPVKDLRSILRGNRWHIILIVLSMMKQSDSIARWYWPIMPAHCLE